MRFLTAYKLRSFKFPDRKSIWTDKCIFSYLDVGLLDIGIDYDCQFISYLFLYAQNM